MEIENAVIAMVKTNKTYHYMLYECANQFRNLNFAHIANRVKHTIDILTAFSPERIGPDQRFEEYVQRVFLENFRYLWELYPRTMNDETITIDGKNYSMSPNGHFAVVKELPDGWYKLEYVGYYDSSRRMYVWNDGHEWRPEEENDIPDLVYSSDEEEDEELCRCVGARTTVNWRSF